MTYDDLPREWPPPRTCADADTGRGKPCYLLADEDGSAFPSRRADQIEAEQLGLQGRLLGRAMETVASPETRVEELRPLVQQLADSLREALLIAESRGARLGREEFPASGKFRAAHYGTGSPSLPDGPGTAPPLIGAIHDALAHSLASPHALVLQSFPGRDLASASAARRYVRNAARSWGLPEGVVEDLETVTGELVANALEHSGSETVTVTLARTAEAAVVGVTDEGRGRRPVPEPARTQPDQEHGRGLLITDALAARWGKRQTPGGLTAWAEVVHDSPVPVR